MISKKERVVRLLFDLIHGEIFGSEISVGGFSEVDEETLILLYKLAKSHDVVHIVANGLKKHGNLGDNEMSAKYEKQRMLALYRYEQSRYELASLCEVLNEAKIPFMPLKGSVLREYYPEPWMRTSCDIDVLIHEEDCERAERILLERLQYRKEATTTHDLSIFSPSGVHIELHYALNEESYRSFDVLNRIWEHSAPAEDGSYRYVMSDEAFYCYHLAHMAKHFELGGCGIRSFLDLWILDHRMEHDKEARDALLKQEKLLAFADGCRHLSEVWFSEAKGDDLSDRMQAYILNGGVYGTLSNKVVIQQGKSGGRIRYVMRRFFLPYDTLKGYYPILKKRKWLTPVMQVRRWFRILFGGGTKKSLHELNTSREVSVDERNGAEILLTRLGLK